MEYREPTLEVAIGFRGVGKTYTFDKICDDYIKNLRRPVLVFDVNNEYTESNKYYGYKAIDFNALEPNEFKRSEQIRNIKVPGRYRIIPMKKNRQPMTTRELLITATTIVAYFRNGMVLLEDINKYNGSHFKQEFIGTFVGLRHLGVDLVLHFQSLHAIPPKVWDGMEYLRWHKCAEKIVKYKQHVTNFELFSIAEAIVDSEYSKGNTRFFLWVNALGNKIEGVTQEQFTNGCRNFLQYNPSVINGMMNNIDLEGGKKKYGSRLDAINDFVKIKSQEFLPV